MISGTTIKIKATFYDINDALVDPDYIIFKVYDSCKTPIYAFRLTGDNRISLGLYEINYTLPNDTSIYYEFAGVTDDFVTLNREEVKISFA